MSYTIVGLGNPGETYENTRHNAGAIVVDALRRSFGFPDWYEDRTAGALLSNGSVAGHEVQLALPTRYMNESGASVRKLDVSPDELIVVHDELDMPLGAFKISVGRGSGGHNGVESVAKALGSKAFTRVRLGVSPTTLFGKMKKPRGERAVHDFILKRFSKRERAKLDEAGARAIEALDAIVKEGSERAMNRFN